MFSRKAKRIKDLERMLALANNTIKFQTVILKETLDREHRLIEQLKENTKNG